MTSPLVPERGRRPGDVRYRVARRPKLPRTLGAGALFSACYGNVGSSIYYGLGVTAAFALGLTPLALILAGGIFVTTALNYAEGTAAMPHAGGSSSFARRAFNAPLGYLVGWIQLLNYTATVSISAYTAIAYLAVLGEYLAPLKVLTHGPYTVGAAVVLIGLLMAVNVIGIQESSAMNLLLALLELGTQLVLVAMGVILLLNIQVVIGNIHWGVAPTWPNFLASISIAMVTYTGIETISNMSEEARNPARTVPRATYGVIVAVLFVSAFLPTIGMSVFPVHLDAHGQFTTDLATRWVNDPVAGIVSHFQPHWLAELSGVWVAILAFTILVIATNAGLIGISRLSYSLATNDLFPAAFSRLHPKFKTPFVSIIVFGIAAAILVLPGQIALMGAVYSLAATFAFCSAHLSVMRLRYVEPELYRPYRMPFNIKFGRSSIPMLSVIGALGIGAVFAQLLFQNVLNSTWVFLAWLVAAPATFIAYRLYHKGPLWEPLEVPPALETRAPIYERYRVPYETRVRLGRREPDVILHPAAEPAARHHRRTRLLGLRMLILRHGSVRNLLITLVVLGLLAAMLILTGVGHAWAAGVLMVVLAVAWLMIRGESEA
ncbi:MAG TPA: APC family permease [Candidatus Dormibacteraeota bacterium]